MEQIYATLLMPRLPPELECLIFEYVATRWPTEVPKLLLVASRVLEWLEPYLYTVLRLDCSDPRTDNVLAALTTKSASFRSSAVRHLLLRSRSFQSAEINTKPTVDILRACPGITTLNLTGDNVGPHLLPILAGLRLERLSMEFRDLFGVNRPVDVLHPLFRAVTHLEIMDYNFPSNSVEALWALPALTHLTFRQAPPPRVLRPLLESCPHLEVVVIFPILYYLNTDAEARRYVAAANLEGPGSRAVVIAARRPYDDDDWERGARGGEDIWARAERFIARKRRGQIQSDNYLLPEAR
ncbi:hypothetical protein FB45DRAFT_929820, partial [Roridomyces roridus]